MKKVVLTLCLIMFTASFMGAQNKPKGNRDLKPLQQIEEWEKVKLIEVLNLNEETSVRFFTRRNEHQKRIREIFNQRDQLAQQIEKDEEAGAHLTEVLAYAVGALIQIADLLVPFLPDTADRIHKTFETGVVVPFDGVLFPKIYIHTADPRTIKA